MTLTEVLKELDEIDGELRALPALPDRDDLQVRVHALRAVVQHDLDQAIELMKAADEVLASASELMSSLAEVERHVGTTSEARWRSAIARNN